MTARGKMFRLLAAVVLMLTLATSAVAKNPGAIRYESNPGNWLFEFDLVWHTDGTLLPNPNIQPGYAGGPRIPYNPVPSPYEAIKASQNNCKGNLLRRNGDVLKTFQFDCQDRRSGRQVKIRTPYDGSSTEVLFLSPEGKRLALIPVQGNCNDNGKCESEAGESKYNCPFDCPSSKAKGRTPKQ